MNRLQYQLRTRRQRIEDNASRDEGDKRGGGQKPLVFDLMVWGYRTPAQRLRMVRKAGAFVTNWAKPVSIKPRLPK